MKVTLGGDRLGSGNKNKIALHNYERSTHNLSQKFTSSMQVGTLYPFLCIPAMRGDTFQIDLAADCRTIPTKAPLFGSFKMQVDLFKCDVRLYQAILHNNPLAIGLKMGQVKFPLLEVPMYQTQGDKTACQFNNSSLLKYLGMSGIGTPVSWNIGSSWASRKINAIPALAYYEIFKTYYSNKQEEYAYYYRPIQIQTAKASMWTNKYINFIEANNTYEADVFFNGQASFYIQTWYNTPEETTEYGKGKIWVFEPNNFIEGWEKWTKFQIDYYNPDTEEIDNYGTFTLQELKEIGLIDYQIEEETPRLIVNWLKSTIEVADETHGGTRNVLIKVGGAIDGGTYAVNTNYQLDKFKLENIDKMRLALLSKHELGAAFTINHSGGDWAIDTLGTTAKPYDALVGKLANNVTMNKYPMNGLVVKTYQSDMFNNWVNTEWITGENGIAAVTAISTSGGSVTIDAINLAEKLYNMLNRIAVADGTYDAWQDAVYTDSPRRHIESPIYMGGMSSEIVFEEIVQTAPAGDGVLGTLAGKGHLIKNKGGHVTIKCDEACFIIGIVSLTPRINYSQGNEFYMTDLMSMDDFHKPALDAIGFQNLIGERMAWWDTVLTNGEVTSRSSIGKIPAWMEYMTAVDKCYGDFADTEGNGVMTLLRHYDMTSDLKIKDATTYCDPRKFNYAFAYSDLDSQNFWVQIYSDIKARRLMSAKQIPNI